MTLLKINVIDSWLIEDVYQIIHNYFLTFVSELFSADLKLHPCYRPNVWNIEKKNERLCF